MSSETERRLLERASTAGLQLPVPLRDSLVIYYDLLQRWNRTINLTSLGNSDEAIDRLLLEPLAAASALPQCPHLMDLGSGGGSPAIPLALALSAPMVVMVESRVRKAAFLREAVRVLGLTGSVENSRFEELAVRPEYSQAMDVVSIRAVRMDIPTLTSAAAFLSATGLLALFENADAELPPLPQHLRLVGQTFLPRRSRLTLLSPSDVPQ
jgi:16S rRNA (guanine527-N7)-methyltransferase